MAHLIILSQVPAVKGGRFAPLARMEVFDAGTLTRRQVYADGALTTPLAQPIVADADGMFSPVFTSSTSDYRVRRTTADGVLIRDIDNISVAVSGGGGGGGGGSSGFTLTTGDYFESHTTGVRTGAVRANGRTIGSASSGASERAHADTEALWKHLYDKDTSLAVSGGRTTRDADWTANKTLALPDARGGPLVGRDGMGAGNAGRLTGGLIVSGDADTLGSRIGAATHTLTEAQLARHKHLNTAATSVSEGAGGCSIDYRKPAAPTAHFLTPGGNQYNLVGGDAPETTTGPVSAGAHTASTTMTNADAGSGQAHNNLPPGLLVTIYLVL